MLRWLWRRLNGHFWHGEEIATAYMRQPDGQMVPSGMIVHMRCLRCGQVEKRRVGARPSSPMPVSLGRAEQE
jgi:hypothetical protein